VHRTPGAAALLDDLRGGPALAAAALGVAAALGRLDRTPRRAAGVASRVTRGDAGDGRMLAAVLQTPTRWAVAGRAHGVNAGRHGARARVLAAPDAFGAPVALVSFERVRADGGSARGPGTGAPGAARVTRGPAAELGTEGRGGGRAAARFGLTPREADVGACLVAGLTNAQAAAHLGVSPHTVRRLGERVYRKAGVRSRVELVHRWRAAASEQ
jgi:DNA-binding CsgD family transcriptional regulator